MSLDKNRRQSILDDIKRFFEAKRGFPETWQTEIDALSPEDLFDELDILITHLCAPEWGGAQATRNFLALLGVQEEDAETLIADNCDLNF